MALVDFNSAIDAIRQNQADMLTLISKWKEMLSTTAADVTFTFFDNSTTTFPNLAKLIQQYGTFPYDELTFEDTSDTTKTKTTYIGTDKITITTYIKGQPGTTKSITLDTSAASPYILVRTSSGTSSQSKLTESELAISGTNASSTLTKSGLGFSSTAGQAAISSTSVSLKDSTSAYGLSMTLEEFNITGATPAVNTISAANLHLGLDGLNIAAEHGSGYYASEIDASFDSTLSHTILSIFGAGTSGVGREVATVKSESGFSHTEGGTAQYAPTSNVRGSGASWSTLEDFAQAGKVETKVYIGKDKDGATSKGKMTMYSHSYGSSGGGDMEYACEISASAIHFYSRDNTVTTVWTTIS